jgi:hypothetical protein
MLPGDGAVSFKRNYVQVSGCAKDRFQVFATTILLSFEAPGSAQNGAYLHCRYIPNRNKEERLSENDRDPIFGWLWGSQ